MHVLSVLLLYIHMSACYELASFIMCQCVYMHVVTDACMLAYSHTVAIAIAIRVATCIHIFVQVADYFYLVIYHIHLTDHP